MRISVLLKAGFAVVFGLGVAQANIIDWTLTEPIFMGLGNSGGTPVTGYFAFDADTDTASVWHFDIPEPLFSGGIVLTPATSTFTFQPVIGLPPGPNLWFFSNASGVDSCGNDPCPAVELDLLFSPPLTNAGGTATVEAHLVVDVPNFGSFGSVSPGAATSVPEPSYLLLLGLCGALSALFICCATRRVFKGFPRV